MLGQPGTQSTAQLDQTQLINSDDRATTVLSGPAQGNGFDSLLGDTREHNAVGDEVGLIEDEEKPKDKSGQWRWWLVGAIALLAIALGILSFALLRGGDPEPTPTPTNSPVETTPEETEPETISISAADYIGLTYEEAAAQLTELGLVPVRVEGNSATDESQVGTVHDINPTGNVRPGASISVMVYTQPEALEAPSSAPTVSLEGSTQLVISGLDNTCPAGLSFEGFTVTTAWSGGDTETHQTSNPSITVAVPAGVTAVNVSYIRSCGGQDSPSSPATQYTMNFPEPPSSNASSSSDSSSNDGASNSGGNENPNAGNDATANADAADANNGVLGDNDGDAVAE